MGLAALLLALSLLEAEAGEPRVLFPESFEDTQWTSGGGYDGPHMEIVTADDAPEGESYCVWHWRAAGDVGPSGGGARLPLPPVEDVSLSFWLRFDPDWT